MLLCNRQYSLYIFNLLHGVLKWLYVDKSKFCSKKLDFAISELVIFMDFKITFIKDISQIFNPYYTFNTVSETPFLFKIFKNIFNIRVQRLENLCLWQNSISFIEKTYWRQNYIFETNMSEVKKFHFAYVNQFK